GQRAAIGMRQAVIGMDQHAERRGKYRLGALRPRLERPMRRAVEGIKRGGAKRLGKTVQRAPAPAVERMRPPVGGFRRSGEDGPLRRPGEAEKQHAADARERADLLLRLKQETAAQDQADLAGGLAGARERVAHAPLAEM